MVIANVTALTKLAGGLLFVSSWFLAIASTVVNYYLYPFAFYLMLPLVDMPTDHQYAASNYG